jgi:hypothetical protein
MFILIIALTFSCPERKESKKELYFPQEEYFKAKDSYYDWKEKIGTKQLTDGNETCILKDVKSGSRKVGAKK